MADVLDRKVATSPLPSAKPQPAGHWEAEIIFFGKNPPVTMRGRIVFELHQLGDLMAGHDQLCWSRNDGQENVPVETDIEGHVDRDSAKLDFSMLHKPLGHSPLMCTADATESGETYRGKCAVDCLDPVNCNCGGGEGDFTLWKRGGEDTF